MFRKAPVLYTHMSVLWLIVTAVTTGASEIIGDGDYFPLNDGMKWTYDSDGNEVIKSIEKTTVDGQELWVVSNFGPWGVFKKATVSLKKDGVTVQKFGKSAVNLSWLKYPLKKGEKWTATVNFGDAKADFEMEILGEETIEVPAGKYACIKVKAAFKDQEGTSGEWTTWYADGVGEVKSSFAATENARKKVTLTRQLKKFESSTPDKNR